MFRRVPEDFIDEAPWNAELPQDVNAAEVPPVLEIEALHLRSAIRQADDVLGEGKVDEVIDTNLPLHTSALQSIRSNYEVPGVSKEDLHMFVDVADYLWGWGSHAKAYGHGKLPFGVSAGEGEQQLSPHQILWKAAATGSTPTVTHLLLNFRFKLKQVLTALYHALSNGCTSEISPCPFFIALENGHYQKSLDDFSAIVEYHVRKYPPLLVEAKSSRGEPLLVTAIRLTVPWSLTKLFFPETLPTEWLNSRRAKPFGADSITKDEFLAVLKKRLRPDSPHYIPLRQAISLQRTALDKEQEKLAQARNFPGLCEGLTEAIINKHINTAEILERLHLMIEILDTPGALDIVSANMNKRNFSKKEFGLLLGKFVLDCAHAESFLAILTVCKPFISIVQCPHSTPTFVNEVAECFQAFGVHRVDEPDPQQPDVTPVNIALQHGKLALLRVLAKFSNQLTIAVNNREITLLAHVLSSPVIRRAAASNVDLVVLALALIQQARRVLVGSDAENGENIQSLADHVNKTALDGNTPLALAFGLDDDGLLDDLFAAGANLFASIVEKKRKTTLCHMLIEQGKNVELDKILSLKEIYKKTTASDLARCVDSRGFNLMDSAVSMGNKAEVTTLFKFGASLLPFKASSPLIKALKKQKDSPGKDIDALVKELLTDWSFEHTTTLLGPATQQHHPLLVSFMKAHHPTVLKPYSVKAVDRTKLFQAAVDAVKESSALLDLLLESFSGKQSAAALKIHDAVEFLTENQMQRLIKAGANLTKRYDGVKLHFKAVQVANIPVLTVLLNAGMDLQETDMEGNSLLHWAVLKTPAETRDPVVQYLVEKEPNLLFALNSNNQIPREYAKSKRLKRLLQEWEEEQSKKAAAAGNAAAEEAGGRLRKRGAGDQFNKGLATEISEEDIGELTVLGPLDESVKHKRRRLAAMIKKLPAALNEDPSSLAAATEAKDSVVIAGDDKAAGDDAHAAASFGSIVTAAADATLPDVPLAAVEVYDSEDDYVDDNDESEPLSASGSGTAAVGFTDIDAALQGLPWELIVTREAYLEWGGMDASYRRMVLMKLREIGQGRWEVMGACKRRQRDVPPELNLWRCKFTKAGRIVFDIAQDFSASKGIYTDLIRIWAITLDHKRYMNEAQKVIQSFAKSHRVTAALRLTPVDGSGNNGADTATGPREHKAENRLPRIYCRQGGGDEMQLAAAATQAAKQQDVLQYPPATAGQGSYTLLKFFDLTTELARAILAGLAGSIEAPFRVSAEETRIITSNPGRSIILAGRSGTGKTTCACFKLFARWLTAWRLGEPHNQVFVTASGTLRREVARSFAKMRRAVVPPEVADELEALAQRPLITLKDVPAEAFPLFLSQKNYLEALDGTLAVPFFPRREDGSILWERGGDASDPDGMSKEIDLSPESDDDESEEDISDDEGNFFDGDRGEDRAASGGAAFDAGASSVRRWHRQEMGFTEFQTKWSQFVPHDLRKGTRVPPALVWTDLVSYIKGSAEAVRSATGHLTLEQYLEVGRKRAPNFDSDLRTDVYRVFEGYEKYKRIHSRYDTADVVGHISRRLVEEGGYNGIDISAIFRDEVQDFMQGELLLDLRVSSNPNELMLAGDSAQTIARGLGFRFTDIQTLFYEEGTAALAAQKEASERLRKTQGAAGLENAAGAGAGRVGASGAPLAMPIIEHLTVNYRTHSGILDAAASTVELLRRYFPLHIDTMQREKAFFSGPPVLLVCGGGAEDMARLLCWSDKQTSQVEFGAHQVVLVRNEEAALNLPRELQGARPLTIPQAKGLEFDDVLLWNFFSDSMVKKEWRVLLNYLEELDGNEDSAARLLPVEEAEQGVGKLGHDALRPLENVDLVAIRPLCDELKHLYTALTRAKNFVAIVDCDAEARAPFYYFLARLGLGKVVTDVGEVDKSHLGLSKVESTPVDWAQLGAKLMVNELFEYAATSFAKAGDIAMEQYCHARDAMAQAKKIAAEERTVARQLYLTAGLQLMDLAINGTRPLELREAMKTRGQAEYTRRVWARHACNALERAGESRVAASLMVKLGRFKRARRLLLDAGDIEGVAKYCAEASADLLAQGKEQAAMQWSVEAFKQYKNVRQYNRCVEMLQAVPNLSESIKRLPGAVGDPAEEVAHHMLIAAQSSGDTAGALAASKYVRDPQVRMGLLRKAGMWIELVEIMDDDVAAAEILMEHVGFAEASERLLAAVGKKKKASEKEARLLCQCAVYSADPERLKESFDVLELAQLDSALSGPLAAMLAIEAARCLDDLVVDYKTATQMMDTMEDFEVTQAESALSSFYKICSDIAQSMISSFSSDFSKWKDAKKRPAQEVSQWPIEALRRESYTIVSSAKTLMAEIKGERCVEELANVLAELSLARFNLYGDLFGMLRCLPLVRQHPDRYKLLPSAIHNSLMAIKDTFKWLSSDSSSATLSLSASAKTLLKDLTDYWGVVGFKLDNRSNQVLTTRSSSSKSHLQRGNKENEKEGLVSWRKHDARFLGKISDFRNFTAKGNESDYFLMHDVPLKEAKCVLAWLLANHFRSYSACFVSWNASVPCGPDQSTLARVPGPEMQMETLKECLNRLRTISILNDIHSAVNSAVSWLVGFDSLPLLLHNSWQQIMSLTFPAVGNSAESIEAIVTAFPNHLTAADFEERDLLNWALRPFVEAMQNKGDVVKALANADGGVWLWKVSMCLLPGAESRRRMILNQLQCVSDIARKQGLPEARLLLENEHGSHQKQHPATLLFGAVDSLRAGSPRKAVDSLSQYLSMYIGEDFGLALIHPEAAVSVFELAASLASLACMAEFRQRPPTHVSYIVNNGILQSIYSIKDIDLSYYVERFASPDSRWFGWINGMLSRLAGAAIRVINHLGTFSSEEQETNMLKAVLLRRLTLSSGALVASAMANSATPSPKLSTRTVHMLGSAVKALETAVAAHVSKLTPRSAPKSSTKKGSSGKIAAVDPIGTILTSITNALGAMAAAKNLNALLAPLRSLAREHGISLLQISQGGAESTEFDVFPASGPLHELAMRKLPGSINALNEQALAAAKHGTGSTKGDSTSSADAGTASAVEKANNTLDADGQDSSNSEEEARAAAGLVVYQAWKAYRQAKKRKEAIQRLKQSISVRIWLRMTVRQYRALKKAEAEQAAARALSEQSYAEFFQMDATGGLRQWRAPLEAYANVFRNRYSATKYSLNAMVSTTTCLICSSTKILRQQQQQPAYQETEKAGKEKSSGKLLPTAPTFMPHTFTEEHQESVAAFQMHCAWYEERAAPCLAEAYLLAPALKFVVENKNGKYQDHIDQARYWESVLSIRTNDFRTALELMELQKSWKDSSHVFPAILDNLINICSNGRALLEKATRDTDGAGAAGTAGASENGGGDGEMKGGAAGNDGVFDDLLDLEDGKDDEYGDLEDGFVAVGRGRKGRAKGKRNGGKIGG